MKAVALVSGGLDSRLAAKLVRGQGIDVLPLTFRLPFSHRNKKGSAGSCDKNTLIRRDLGCELSNIGLDDVFLEMVKNPPHGYGANLNPCIDCKIFMLRKAAGFMRDNAAEFIITGEVLGQRPMSQHKQALATIEKEAGLQGLVLRPLSAKLLSETIPEREGWVNRDRLMGFCGRGRRPQIELARELGVEDYPNPAGGCLLTDPDFSRKLKDLINSAEFNLENIELLKSGRYFRLKSHAKLIVGRDEQENNLLAGLAKEGDYLFYPGPDLAGPTSLGRGAFSEGLIKLACRITCYYCDLNGIPDARIFYKRIPAGDEEFQRVSPIGQQSLQEFRR
ncbi:MAG: tRNA 4-thiouridine(8) synthase ThiI [Candidatus Omnitrophica bacterium]|nr:tRNA 4-thiouridine(8) synthase ThiI [Candidatus Omnitrophota bacterium]MBL7210425.1 tRNA 4-thiouridine(8) synthase ThiI [Candidatus Omnitrophota bacterium]